MRILVIGGNGMVGAHAARRLRDMGHDVEIASRNPPPSGSPVDGFAFHRLDYVEDDPDPAWLGGYEAIVFTAGNDPRHYPEDGFQGDVWEKNNSIGIPRFVGRAKAAGVGVFILIGSFYPQAAPQLLGTNAYVDSRLAADEGARAFADDGFKVIVLNAPYILGHVAGLGNSNRKIFADWALGRRPDIPRFAPPGGANVISCDTLTDAIVGAIEGGTNGKAYLIGDENLSYQTYLGYFLKAAGDEASLPEEDRTHPFFPPVSTLAGHGACIHYPTDPAEVAELGYRRNDIARTAKIIVDAYR